MNVIAEIERMGLNVDQELFSAFVFYAAIVLIKMLLMVPLTHRCFFFNTPTQFFLRCYKSHF